MEPQIFNLEKFNYIHIALNRNWYCKYPYKAMFNGTNNSKLNVLVAGIMIQSKQGLCHENMNGFDFKTSFFQSCIVKLYTFSMCTTD